MIKWGEIVYEDCLDQDVGLPSLPDNSIDLGITDPPFNIGYGNSSRKCKGWKWDEANKFYKDDKEDYLGWCQTWFKELRRVCKNVVIYCGVKNEYMWIADIEKPKGTAYRYILNSKSGSSISYLARLTPILIYGKLDKRLRFDYFDYMAIWGFIPHAKFIHPCPINKDFWLDLIHQLNPQTVIDPFMRSARTAEVCMELDIKWTGYELDPAYEVDFNKRKMFIHELNEKQGDFLDL